MIKGKNENPLTRILDVKEKNGRTPFKGIPLTKKGEMQLRALKLNKKRK